MNDLRTVRTLLRYSDWANEQVVRAAAGLPPAHLDKVFDIGRGTMRRTLLHILAGEMVWLKRWKGERDAPWPNEDEVVSPSLIWERFSEIFPQRERFLAELRPEEITRSIVYRDSKGSLFAATLGDMMIQMCTHSTHHRSQAVNLFRRLGTEAPELDYMMWVRQPV